MKTTIFTLVVEGLLILSGQVVFAQETKVKITSLRSEKGKIILNVYNSSEAYEEDTPSKIFAFPKDKITSGTKTVNINLKAGTYGIALLDDENGNGKMDKNFIKMPKEGFGFSNFYMEKLKKPSFEDFKFRLVPGESKIEIKAKYL